MKQWFKDLLSNRTNVSSSRVVQFMIVISAISLAIYDTIHNGKLDTSNLVALLTAGTTGYTVGVVRDTLGANNG